MSCSSLSNLLLVTAVALVAIGTADARPAGSLFEPSHVTFSSASRADARIDISSRPTGEPDDDADGPPGRASTFGKVSHDLDIDKVKFHGKHAGVAPVSAIPEPPTLALLVAGLAGVAVIAKRRRPRL